MMLKKLRTLIIMGLSAVICISATACFGEQSGPVIDKNKTQIYVSAYDGGNGTDWLDVIAEKWSANNDKYQVVPVPEKVATATIISTIRSGVNTETTPSVYIAGEPGYQELIYGGYLEDLSDVVSRKADGEDKGTILQKMGHNDEFYEEWKRVASKNGSGLYMLPYTDNFGLMVFNFDSFLENGWMFYPDADDASVKAALTEQGVEFHKEGKRLIVDGYTGDYKYFNYEEGDVILTCGKDGIYGSYDDGQPQTEAEFKTLIDKITTSNSNSRAFVWTSMYSDYVDMVVDSYMYQYMGKEEYDTFYTFDGTITVDGQPKKITLENGKEVYGNDGFKKAVKFLNDYYVPVKNSYSQSLDGMISHTEAQSYFLMADLLKNEGQEHGNILIDGEWFENEAKATFNSLESSGKGWGKQEFRMLLLPKIDGQKGIDGNGNGSVVSVLNNGSIIVPKQEDAGKLSAIKDFLTYLLSDENLQLFTLSSGASPAYRFDLSDEQFDKLTPFAKNCYVMYHDAENIVLSRFQMKAQTSAVRLSSTRASTSTYPIRLEGAPSESVIKAFKLAKTDSVNKIVNGAKSYYSNEIWAEIVASVKASGIYGN